MTALDATPTRRIRPPLRGTSRDARRAFVLTGGIITAALVAYAVITPLVIPSDRVDVSPADRLLRPSLFDPSNGNPLLGTDHLGRDLALLCAQGMRTSMLIAVAIVAGSALLGWIVGGVCGFLGGWTDAVGSRTMELFHAFPGLVLALSLVTVMGPSVPTVIITLILISWVSFARVVRARALSLSREYFIDAAVLSNVSRSRMLLTHVRLNTSVPVFTLAIIEIPRAVMAEASMSFLGFGVQPPQTSLGAIISSERDYLLVEPWLALFPAALLVLVCIGTALVGLGIRGRRQGYGL